MPGRANKKQKTCLGQFHGVLLKGTVDPSSILMQQNWLKASFGTR